MNNHSKQLRIRNFQPQKQAFKKIAFFMCMWMILLTTKGYCKWIPFPIFAYSDSLGPAVGFFSLYNPPSSNAQIAAISLGSKSGYFANISLQEWPILEKFNVDLGGNISQQKELFYGFGNNTSGKSPTDIYAKTSRTFLSVSQDISNVHKFIWGIELKTIQEQIAKQDNVRFHPDEFTLNISFGHRYDTRDERFNATQGQSVETKLVFAPRQASSLKKENIIIEWDYRCFKPYKKTVFATRLFLSNNISISPTFLYIKTLGSDAEMRGVQTGRYRGKAITLGQIEYRFPLLRWMSGSIFYELGKSGDTIGFSGAHSSYGYGLHFPMGKGNLRISFGRSKDASQRYVTFNHAF